MAKNDAKAQDYRAERKERLAKNAKKASKKAFDSAKLASTFISVLLVLVVVALAVFLVFKLEVPHRLLPALEVNGRTYTVAEYSYFYNSVSNTYFNSNSSIKLTDKIDDGEDGQISYADLFKKQTLESIESSNYYLAKCEEEGVVLSAEHEQELSEIVSQIQTYADQYRYSFSRYVSLAYGKGLTEKVFKQLLTEQLLVAQYVENLESECYAEITDEELESAYAEDPAAYQSVDIRLFGFEVPADEKTTETETETTTTADETTTAEGETTEETTVAEEETTVAETVEKDPTETELLAKEMLDRITDEDSFMDLAYEYAEEEDKETFKDGSATLAKSIKKSVVETNIGSDVAEWLYAEDRATGDKNMFTTDDYVYVIYIIKPMYRNEEALVDARHILVSFDEVAATLGAAEGNTVDTEKKDDVEVETALTEEELEITNEGTGYSIELVTEAYKQARDIYDKYMSGEKTEDSFAALAEEYSADTGSVGEQTAGGGLYESIERGKMVEPFENWVYEEGRKAGDVDLVMTNYGWHIMYFVKQHDEPAWKTDVRAALGAEKFEALSEELTEEISGSGEEKAFFGFAVAELEKTIKKNSAAASSHEGHDH